MEVARFEDVPKEQLQKASKSGGKASAQRRSKVSRSQSIFRLDLPKEQMYYDREVVEKFRQARKRCLLGNR